MFYISKIVWSLAQPSMLLVLLVLGAAGLIGTRYRRGGHAMLLAAAVLAVAGGILPLGTWLLLPLEERFPRADLSRGPIDGLIVLGGAEDPRIAEGRSVQALNMAAERMTEALVLARRFPHAKVIFCGGSTSIVLGPAVEADSAGRLLVDLGLERERLLLDRKSRNTFENVLYAKELADPKPGERWLLVTSAWHMPRAMGLFRKAGFPVEPWPVDYWTAGPYDVLLLSGSPSEGLGRLDVATKEWVGLIVNWLTGKSDALLPKP